MQNPNLIINWPAIGVSVVAAFFFGGLWYMALFGKIWGRLMGMSPDGCKPDAKLMIKAFGLQIFGLVLTSYVLTYSNQVWRPSTWGVGQDQPSYIYGFYGGLFTWLGFYVPMQLGKVGWERRPWAVFFINTGHDFLNLQIISQILAHWR